MEIHFASIGLVKTTPDGRHYTNDSAPGIAIKDALHFTQDFRVLPDNDIVSTLGYPTIKTYLEREAALSFKPTQITQTFIVTLKEP